LPEGIAAGLGVGQVAHQVGIEPLLALQLLAQQLQVALGGGWPPGAQEGLGGGHQILEFGAALALVDLAGEQG